MPSAAKLLAAAALIAAAPAFAQAAPTQDGAATLRARVTEAERELQQTFTNLKFEEFGPSPIHGPIYQAIAGGRLLYFAPESGHLLFAAVYDRSGVNVTALAQDESAARRLAAIDPAQALVIGPEGAPKVIEFTDPDCPYCQALERFWKAKAAESKIVQRRIYFVSAIHPGAAAKAEHILCSPDPAAAFEAIYAGAAPATLLTCPAGRAKVEADARTVEKMGIAGTPTLIVDGRLISGFKQAELEAFLDQAGTQARADR
jgi:thiol:disulfide interchange protein DsbC